MSADGRNLSARPVTIAQQPAKVTGTEAAPAMARTSTGTRPQTATLKQDVVVMSLKTRTRAASAQAQQRRTAPSCRGGASSLLRLTQPGMSRLPSTLDIGGWISRATQALKMPPVPTFAPSDFIA